MEDLIEEIKLLRDVFIANGYPHSLVERIIKNSWKSELQKQIRKESEDTVKPTSNRNEFYDVIHSPYVKGFTEKLEKELRKLNIGWVMKKDQTIFSLICNMKEKTPKDQIKDVVYAFECKNCEKIYIGETSQPIIERRKQHMRDVRNGVLTNGIFDHLRTINSHEIEWKNFHILDHEKNWYTRKIKESIFIDLWNPTREISSIMNLEKGKVIEECWKGLHENLRSKAKDFRVSQVLEPLPET
jgi:hypothetical protein